jgi:hypothetical protein
MVENFVLAKVFAPAETDTRGVVGLTSKSENDGRTRGKNQYFVFGVSISDLILKSEVF